MSLWGPDITCDFMHVKQRLLDKNYKSLLALDLTCHFEHAKQRN